MAAAAPALLSIEKYLQTMYHPDRDLVDGQTERRNSSEFDTLLCKAF